MMAVRMNSARIALASVLLAGLADAATPRFARLGSFEGPVEVQLDAADTWRPAALNLPLPESTRIRTGSGARVEIELDDASVLRMVGEGLAELSDYTRLSGGQRITVISVDHGLAYFIGEPGAGNAIHLLVPGAQASLRQGSRIRLNALDASSEIAIVEGAIRFTISSAEMDLHQGQSARVTVPDSTHFSLFREISPLDSDAWSEQLDKAEAQAPSSRLDLDRAGKWIAVEDYGTVWQPAPRADWAPYRQGRWIWFQSVGFTWVGSETWGWTPYHEGRWLQHKDLGWVWIPGPKNANFSPGDVFWARATNLAAWGPLAPAEQWSGAGPPRQFAALNVTAGTYVAGTREILPSPAEDLPKDLLKAFLFTAALPSPPLPVARLNAMRETLRTRLFSAVDVAPVVPQITEAAPPATDAQPVADTPTPVQPASAPPPAAPADPDPPDVLYPYPVYTGIVVVNPPEKGDHNSTRKHNNGNSSSTSTSSSSSTTGGNSGSGPKTNPPPPVKTVSEPHRTPPSPTLPERVNKPLPTEGQRTATKETAPVVSRPTPPPAPASAPVRVEVKAEPAAAKTDTTSKSK
jgi:hypothetical protein